MRTLLLLLVLAAFCSSPAPAQRWIALWTEDDSWVAVADDGDIWQMTPSGTPNHVGSFGAGPWVDFTRRSNPPPEYFALKSNGEVWVCSMFGTATLFRTLPSDREWCALELDQEAGYEPYWALTCNGEVWALSDPPQYWGTFAVPPVPARGTTWGRVKNGFHQP